MTRANDDSRTPGPPADVRLAPADLADRNRLIDALINSPVDMMIFALDRNGCYVAFNEAHRLEMRRVWHADIRLGTPCWST